jgi:hypothetical protein
MLYRHSVDLCTVPPATNTQISPITVRVAWRVKCTTLIERPQCIAFAEKELSALHIVLIPFYMPDLLLLQQRREEHVFSMLSTLGSGMQRPTSLA